jgi:CTP:molybdopterin cytidylyltransferase MocA
VRLLKISEVIFLTTPTPAIILAAGASTRLGSPKALVEWNGETLIELAVRQLKEAGVNEIVIVTRSELAVDLLTLVSGSQVAINTEPELGRNSSIQVGILSLMKEKGRIPQRVLIVPVDRCGWQVDTVERLLEQKQSCTPEPAGHPVLLYEIEAVLAADGDASLRSLFNPERIAAPGIRLNIDSPEDVEALP